MKKTLSNPHLMLAAIILLLFSGCSKESSSNNNAPPDPSGTITANLSTSSNLSLGSVTAFLLISYYTISNSSYPTARVQTRNLCNCDTTGVSGELELSLTSNLNLAPGILGDQFDYVDQSSASIANIGQISGLGAITTHPSSGYGGLTSVTTATGYVVKVTSYSPTTFQLNQIQYYRIFVESYQTSTSGGIIGVTLKYQGPF